MWRPKGKWPATAARLMCEPRVSDLVRAAYVGETYLTERERDSDLINVRA